MNAIIDTVIVLVAVSLVQFAPHLGDKHKNFEKMKTFCTSTEHDLVVFGELSLTGYMCRDEIVRLSEPIGGKYVNKLLKISVEYDTHIIFGIPELTDKKLVYNSAILTTPDGNIHVYRKMYLANFGPFEEKLYFAEGTALNIFDTKIGKIGMLICYDLFFPELAKIYALKGADIIVCISASPHTTKYFFENVMVARAIENTVFLLYTNLVGTELNLTFWGGNAIINPRGKIVSKGEYFKECIVSGLIDFNDISVARQFRPTIKDTKFDVLTELLKHSAF